MLRETPLLISLLRGLGRSSQRLGSSSFYRAMLKFLIDKLIVTATSILSMHTNHTKATFEAFLLLLKPLKIHMIARYHEL